MDKNKLGLFSLLLRNHYEDSLHIDVLKLKREKMLLKLELLRDALQEREYDKSNFILLDICDKILHDPYSDEYNMKFVEVDMIVFSSAVLCIIIGNYNRVQQILTGLVLRYRSPVFHYILGVSYFCDLLFKEARNQFIIATQLLSENHGDRFPWPDTDVLIVTISASKMKKDASLFMEISKMFLSLKRLPYYRSGSSKERVEKIEILKTPGDTPPCRTFNIGRFVKRELYPLIQRILGEILEFNKSKLPVEYQEIIDEKFEQLGKDSSQKGETKEHKAETEKTAKRKTKRTESLQSNVTFAPTSLPDCTPAVGKGARKQHQSVQVQTILKSKQSQTTFKNINMATQTREDITGISEKLKPTETETINNLKLKLQQTTQKLKDTEAKLSKNDTEVQEKNKLIEEQQEMISNLKSKLQQSNSKQRELESKFNKANNKLSELTRTNKSIIAESEKHKRSIAELQRCNQKLEQGMKSAQKKYDDMKIMQKSIFDQYRALYFSQIGFYESFHKRCNYTVSILESINAYLTEITVPTKAECEESINQWFSAMISSQETLTKSQVVYNKYNKYVSEESFRNLLHLTPLLPITEPENILVKSAPIMMYTIVDYEKRLQNNQSKIRRDQSKERKPRNDDALAKADYRKKSNFKHKDRGASFIPSSSHYVEDGNVAGNSMDSKENNRRKHLLTFLQQNIPYKTEAEILNALNVYRDSNNGSLSGMTIQYILYNVAKILETRNSLTRNERLPEVEETCPICIEPITDDQKIVLKCNHIYHTACIHEWFTINRVCAVCRKYTILDEDFPPLKS